MRPHDQKPGRVSLLDSLTNTYLTLHDTLVFTWNSIQRDESQKIEIMNQLISKLEGSKGYDKTEIVLLRTRLEQLQRIQFTPRTLANSDVVDEYNFASNNLIAELIALSESNAALLNHPDWQQLIDEIQTIDMRGVLEREMYDSLAWQLNSFIEENLALMPEIAPQSGLEKTHYFNMN
jgi:hypothetical protein